MALFDKVGERIAGVGGAAVRGAKDMAESASLNSKIGEERKKIESLYSQIGKVYYDTEAASADGRLGELCGIISAANARIAEYDKALLTLKGATACLGCGELLPQGATFCGACGKPIPKPEPPAVAESNRFCTNCGAQLPGGAAFCTKCGQRLD